MNARILVGDALRRLREIPDSSVQCCLTSPPYWRLRDYLIPGQLGLEKTPAEYIEKMVEVFAEVRRILRGNGTCWVNIGDNYAAGGNGGHRKGEKFHGHNERNGDMTGIKKDPPVGLKVKDLVGIPWMLAFALRANGWYLRNEIIWAKPNGMPGSQEDRCTSAHEAIFLLSKKQRYYSDFDAIKTPPRESSMVRLAQDIQAQAGSHRANGGAKDNGAMKAVQRKSDKQRGHSRRHNGFNDRWDQMSVEEQQSMPAMMRDVWFVAPAQFRGEHFAVMPDEIARRCILAGSREGDVILDPFCGRGTTGIVALRYGREFVGIELSPKHAEMAKEDIIESAPLFNTVTVEVSTSSLKSSSPSESSNLAASTQEAVAP